MNRGREWLKARVAIQIQLDKTGAEMLACPILYCF